MMTQYLQQTPIHKIHQVISYRVSSMYAVKMYGEQYGEYAH